ncbi:hypothetical protein E3A20_28290 [Planctomyces bekefii]|uniref:Lipoprotein n=1 Tax=Planctomyces bekefii TaxID=1653850 RepID=A0A5C6M1J6_9PLAN|nr:hypothetical protein E3A20_28290 [Planctomyces bekefii]
MASCSTKFPRKGVRVQAGWVVVFLLALAGCAADDKKKSEASSDENTQASERLVGVPVSIQGSSLSEAGAVTVIKATGTALCGSEMSQPFDLEVQNTKPQMLVLSSDPSEPSGQYIRSCTSELNLSVRSIVITVDQTPVVVLRQGTEFRDRTMNSWHARFESGPGLFAPVTVVIEPR